MRIDISENTDDRELIDLYVGGKHVVTIDCSKIVVYDSSEGQHPEEDWVTVRHDGLTVQRRGEDV